jgi:hypothetical protein
MRLRPAAPTTDAAYLCRVAQKVNKNIALQYSGITIMPKSPHTLTN